MSNERVSQPRRQNRTTCSVRRPMSAQHAELCRCLKWIFPTSSTGCRTRSAARLRGHRAACVRPLYAANPGAASRWLFHALLEFVQHETGLGGRLYKPIPAAHTLATRRPEAWTYATESQISRRRGSERPSEATKMILEGQAKQPAVIEQSIPGTCDSKPGKIGEIHGRPTAP
jgi:hypothetical protein